MVSTSLNSVPTGSVRNYGIRVSHPADGYQMNSKFWLCHLVRVYFPNHMDFKRLACKDYSLVHLVHHQVCNSDLLWIKVLSSSVYISRRSNCGPCCDQSVVILSVTC